MTRTQWFNLQDTRLPWIRERPTSDASSKVVVAVDFARFSSSLAAVSGFETSVLRQERTITVECDQLEGTNLRVTMRLHDSPGTERKVVQ